MKKAVLLATLALSTAAMPSIALAEDEFNVAPGLTAEGAPLGLHGVDPVAFLTIGNRVEGRAEYTAVHEGVAYYFSTEENRKIFRRNPDEYTPQYGGFCAFGVSVAKKFDGDPQFAAVMDDKLYVFLNEEIFKMYQKDRSGTISKAESNWKKIKHTAAREL